MKLFIDLSIISASTVLLHKFLNYPGLLALFKNFFVHVNKTKTENESNLIVASIILVFMTSYYSTVLDLETYK